MVFDMRVLSYLIGWCKFFYVGMWDLPELMAQGCIQQSGHGLTTFLLRTSWQ